ncbi:MAG: hypothetical protein Q8L01_03345 [Candidatus Woesebacteria bacterium]|nr:hypothetical protein [Candidatus Woesebacteria bacterium]
MERYSLYEAEKEAGKMQNKIETGEAKNYSRAEEIIKQEAEKKLRDSFLKNRDNDRLRDFGLSLYEARRQGLEIDEEVDQNLGRIIESQIYNSLLRSYKQLIENNGDAISVSNALSSIQHEPVQSLGALNNLKIKDAHFASELGLFLGYCYEVDNSYVNALSHYDKSGHLDKLKELVIKIMESSDGDFVQENFDFEKENKEHYPIIRDIQYAEMEKDKNRYAIGDSEVEKMHEERRLRAKDLKSKLETFLQEFSEKKDVDEAVALEIIRRKLGA